MSFPLIPNIEITQHIGTGAFSQVYLGRHEKLEGLEVVCKIIAKQPNPDFKKKLERETTLLNELDHPNISKLVEVVDESSRRILITKYLPHSTDLFDFLQGEDGPLPIDRAMKIFGPLVMAVRHCHDENITHSDLKLENIVFAPATNDLELIDFGFSRKLGILTTLVFTPNGTLPYASPELLASKGYDAKKNDVWALGIILFAILAGELPFYHENAAQLNRMIQKGNFKMPNYIDYSSADLIKLLLNPDPQKRPCVAEIIQSPLCQKYSEYFVDGKAHSTNQVETFESDTKK